MSLGEKNHFGPWGAVTGGGPGEVLPEAVGDEDGKAEGTTNSLLAPPLHTDRHTGLRGNAEPKGVSTALPRPQALPVGTKV